MNTIKSCVQARPVFLMTLLLLLGSVEGLFAQNRQPKMQIEPGFPSVDASFAGMTEGTSPREDQSGKLVLLRIRNNIRTSIRFCSFGLGKDGEAKVFAESSLWLSYEVEISDTSLWLDKSAPPGVPVGGMCVGYSVPSGKSILIPFPIESLLPGLSIRIPFAYGWERPDQHNPKHYLYFDSAKIPQGSKAGRTQANSSKTTRFSSNGVTQPSM